MILQCGTTGFRHYKAPLLPVVDLCAFRAVFHTVARDLSADVIHNVRRRPDVECNFAGALLQLGNDRIVVLLNCIHPLVAFAADIATAGPPEFRDHPELVRVFSAHPDFTVIPAATLELVPTPDMLANLAPTEIEQCNYWKPNRLGDVIFNCWD